MGITTGYATRRSTLVFLQVDALERGRAKAPRPSRLVKAGALIV